MTIDFDALLTDNEDAVAGVDDRAVEATLLEGILDPTVAAPILEATRPDDYLFDAHRQAAFWLYRLAGRGRHIDRVTLRAAMVEEEGDAFVTNSLDDDDDPLRKTFDFVAQVIETGRQAPPPAGKVLSYLDIFVAQAKTRQARELLAKTAKALDDRKITPEGVAGDVLKAVVNLEATRRLSGAAQSEGEELDAYFAALEAAQSATNDFQGLDTGFSHLNRLINGLSPGLIVLGAMPSTGKTTFAKQIADQVIEKHSDAACLFVSLEQSKEELRVKTLSRLSGVENRDMQRGRLDTQSPAWAKVVEAKDAFAGFAGRLQVLEGDRATTVDRIRLAALQLRQKTQAARLLVVVDYLQIMPVEGNFGDTRQKVTFVTSELRRLARELDAPVLAIASVNRAAYNAKGGSMEAFKESGDIEFSADVGLILVEDKDRKGDANYLGVMRKWRGVNLDVVKNRNGERGRIRLEFLPEVSRFREVSKESLPDD